MIDFRLENKIEEKEYNKILRIAIKGLSSIVNLSSTDIVIKAHEIARENILFMRDLYSTGSGGK